MQALMLEQGPTDPQLCKVLNLQLLDCEEVLQVPGPGEGAGLRCVHSRIQEDK